MSINTCIKCGTKYCVNDTYACSCGEVKVVEQESEVIIAKVYLEKLIYENRKLKETLKTVRKERGQCPDDELETEQEPVATVTQVYLEKIMYENERYRELLKNLKEAIKTDCVECGGCYTEPVTCPITELNRAVRDM